MPRIKKISQTFFFTLLTVVVFIVVLEMFLHSFERWKTGYIPDKYCEMIMRPNMVHDINFGRTIKTNSLGLRDSEIDIEKQEDIKRILVLGDSTTFGLWLDSKDSYPEQLERLLNGKAEVINAGVPGYCTRSEVAYLEHYGFKLKPDIVILGFFMGNDIIENHPNNYLFVRGRGAFGADRRMISSLNWKMKGIIYRTSLFCLVDDFFNQYRMKREYIDAKRRLVDSMLENLKKAKNKGDITHSVFIQNIKEFSYFIVECLEPPFSDLVTSEFDKIFMHFITGKCSEIELTEKCKSLFTKALLNEKPYGTPQPYTRSAHTLYTLLFQSDMCYKDGFELQWEATFKDIKKMVNLCRENKTDFYVLVIPDPLVITDWLKSECRRYNLCKKTEPDFEMPYRKMEAFLNQEEIGYINIIDKFSQNKSESIYFKHDNHPDSIGYRIIAESISECLFHSSYEYN